MVLEAIERKIEKEKVNSFWKLNEAGVQVGVFHVDNRDYTYNKELMNAISVELENLQWIESGEEPTGVSGSQGQLTYNLSYGPEDEVEKRGDFLGESLLNIVGPISLMGIRHLYRIRHNVAHRNWSVVWGQDHTFNEVPQNWTQTINALRNREYPEINVGRYNAEVYSPIDFVRVIVHRDNEKAASTVKKK